MTTCIKNSGLISIKSNNKLLMEKFKELVADLLEYDEVIELDMNTPMKDLDDWDSLTLLGFLAMIENDYNIQIDIHNLNVNLSFKDFYNQFLVA